jgi:peptidoglycan/xylan/chitin deacetylase (PgdA/CDA1 family)
MLLGPLPRNARRWLVLATALLALVTVVFVVPPAVPATTAPAVVVKRVPHAGRQVFLTVDDGGKPQDAITKAACVDHVPLVMFLVGNAVRRFPRYFRGLQACGAVVANHTRSHLTLRGRPFFVQKWEICQGQDVLQQLLGVRPVYFRPPRAAYDATTLRAAAACGIRFVMLYQTSAWGGVVSNKSPLHAGDMLLFHFAPDASANMAALRRFAASQGFTLGRFRDHERYLGQAELR